MRWIVPLLLIAGCTMQTLRVANTALPGPPDAVYADCVMALSRVGVDIITQNPSSRLITGQYVQFTGLATGPKVYRVVVRIEPDRLTIQAMVAQAIDYGATARLLRKIEEALRLTYPVMVFTIE